MSIGLHHQELRAAWERLDRAWQQSTSGWADQERLKVENDLWKPLQGRTPMMLMELADLERTVAEVLRMVNCP